MLKETGALISLQPNASKIVSSWGIDSFLAKYGPMPDKAFRVLSQNGELVREIPLDTTRYGADRMLYHRQDLHTALRTAATSSELPGRPAEIRVGCAVESCDTEKGTVELASGETLEGDVVIGADGIHSVLRAAVVGEPREALPTGISAYRMLLPLNLLRGIDVPKTVLDPASPVTTMVVGSDRRVIMGPGRNGTVFGIVALVPDSTCAGVLADEPSWVAEGDLNSLLKVYEGFPEWLLEIFRRAPDHALWQLRDIDPLPTWTRGRTILIGDAAHAMLPTQGQGASQSLEDAEALRAYFADLPPSPSKGDVQDVLEKVVDARYERASLIQKYSRDQAKPPKAEAGESGATTLNPAEFMDYNCNYSGAKEWVDRRKSQPV
jgi:salicylate hydroxylase